MSYRAEPPPGGARSGSAFDRARLSRRRFWDLLLPVLASGCLSACGTARPLPAVNLSEPGWRVQQGQAIWRTRKNAPEVAGELMVATHPGGRTFLQFTKTP